MSLCLIKTMSLSICNNPLPYQQKLPQRLLSNIDLAVIHCTELPDLAMARQYGEKILYPSGTGNSGHYYIDRDGATYCWVEPVYTAHHVVNYNHRSIGIELVNLGRYPHWFNSKHQDFQEPYRKPQLLALIQLLKHLQTQLPCLKYIAGHEYLDNSTVAAEDCPKSSVKRKLDPGSHFPWAEIMREIKLLFLND